MLESDWTFVCRCEDVPPDGGACVLFQGIQIAIFHIAASDEWYAVQNRCPHWNEQVLWRGLTGEHDGEPKVACPMHKRTYSLRTGAAMGDECQSLATFPVRIDDAGRVFIASPTEAVIERERASCPRSFRNGDRAA